MFETLPRWIVLTVASDCASPEELREFSNMVLDAGSSLARSQWSVTDPISVLLSNATFFEIPRVQGWFSENFVIKS